MKVWIVDSNSVVRAGVELRLLVVATLFLFSGFSLTSIQAQAPSTVNLGENLPVAEVLSKWTEAIGGRQRLAKLRSFHRQMSGTAGGLQEVIDEWVSSSAQRRVFTDRTEDQSTSIFDGQHGWIVDWNGRERELERDEIKSEVDLALVHGFPSVSRLAGPAQLGGSEAGTGFLIVKFSPPAGHPFTYFLDPKTYLPVRVDMDGGVSRTFSDWREVDGVTVPFGEQRKDARESVDYRVEKLELNPSPGPGRYQRPHPGPNDAFFLKGNAPVTVPFNFENNHLMIQTSVNGHAPLWFMIDTGASYTVISQERLAEYGLHPYGGLKTEGGGNNVSGAYVSGVTCRVGGLEVRNQHAAVLPLHGLERVYGMQMGGILGYDFISRFVLEVDYTTHTITFHRPAIYVYRGHGAVVPFSLEGNEPNIDGSITVKGRSIPAHFILDVGAADTATLTSPFVDRNDLVKLAGDPRQQVRTLPGSEKEFFTPTTIRGLLDDIKFGPITMSHVYVNLSRGKSGAYASGAFAGTIGQTIYQRFHNILDYSRRRLILEPDPDSYAPFAERKSIGLTLLADGPELNKFTVTAVGANSAPARAGLKKDDVITGVDGVGSGELTLGKLRDLLAEDGKQVILHVERKGTTLTVPLTVERVPISGLN